MPDSIDYFFTPISPWSYLGHERLKAIAARHRVPIEVKPCDLNQVFAVSGGLPLAQRPPQRQAYRMFELKRWREYLGIPLVLKPKYFPANAADASRWILAAAELGSDAAMKFTGALLRAVWAEERDIADQGTLVAIAGEQDFDAGRLEQHARSPEIGDRLETLTQEAMTRQVFGAPTYIFRDEPFWGQDRLDFLDRALAKYRAGTNIQHN